MCRVVHPAASPQPRCDIAARIVVTFAAAVPPQRHAGRGRIQPCAQNFRLKCSQCRFRSDPDRKLVSGLRQVRSGFRLRHQHNFAIDLAARRQLRARCPARIRRTSMPGNSSACGPAASHIGFLAWPARNRKCQNGQAMCEPGRSLSLTQHGLYAVCGASGTCAEARAHDLACRTAGTSAGGTKTSVSVIGRARRAHGTIARTAFPSIARSLG